MFTIIIDLQPLRKKASMQHVTTMQATSRNVQFPGHNHLLTIAGAWEIIKVLGQYWWLSGGYDLEMGHF